MANTSAQLGQYALNVANAVQQQFLNGQTELSAGTIKTLCGAICLLAEAVIVANNSNTGGGTIPNSILIGKYSATVPSTAPIQL